MLHQIKHYGKEITMLTDKEVELYQIDTEMNELFYKFYNENTNPIENILSFGLLLKLSKKRTELSSEILNLNVSDYNTVEEMLAKIETTEYSFQKFLIDNKMNEDVFDEIELVAHLN